MPCLTKEQCDLVRAICQIAGLQTYALCCTREVIRSCSAFVPVDKMPGCGCRYVPAAVWLTTATFVGLWDGRTTATASSPSPEELRVLHCTRPSDDRLIAYSEVVVDGIVIVLERHTPRTPRTPRTSSATPPLLKQPSDGSTRNSQDDDNESSESEQLTK